MSIISIASSYMGMKEGSNKRFKSFLKEYNAIRPLPRGYHMSVTDAWCAAFVSVCMEKAGIHGYAECSVSIMYQKMASSELLRKSPQAGDIVFYNLNGRYLTHVGIIAKVDGDYLDVIEGNYGNAVGIRRCTKKYSRIAGFAHLPETSVKKGIPDSVVRAVIRGEYGNGEERKKRLQDAGYIYQEVQSAVNSALTNN